MNENAARAVCNALRRRGAHVGPFVRSAAGYRAAFVVRMQFSGKYWSLTVAYEEPVGNPGKTRGVRLDVPSDLPRAADALAEAQLKEDSKPSEVQPPVEFGVTLDAWMGVGSASLVDGHAGALALAVGATALMQYKLLDAGLGASGMGELLGPASSLVSALAGVRLDPVPWFRFDLLAETGAQRVTDAGRGFFSDTIRGGSATLPYLGCRAGLSFLIGRPHVFVLGWWTIMGETLGHQTVQATTEGCFLGCVTTTQTYSIGGPSFMTGLRVGAFIH
jgi:hypothetical protein